MATLFPEAAIRPKRPADPLSCVDMDEKVSVCLVKRISSMLLMTCFCAMFPERRLGKHPRGAYTYSIVNNILRSGIVVNVHRHAAQGRDFGR